MKAPVWFSLLFGLVAFVVAPMRGQGVLADFSNTAELAKWTFYNGPEYPGAKGQFLQSGSLAVLSYDFNKQSDSSSSFDPRYVMVVKSVPADLATNATRVRVTMTVSDVRIAPKVRFYDVTGQAFMCDLLPLVPLEKTGATGVYESVLQAYNYWGGAADGVFHPPLTRVAVVAEGYNGPKIGSLRISKVEILGKDSSLGRRFALGTASLLAMAAPTNSLESRVGVNIHFTTDETAMNAIAESGVKWVRMDITWALIEQSAGVYTFGGYDALVSAAEKRGLGVIAILDYGNVLYTGDKTMPPVTLAAVQRFSAYAQAVAARYKGRKIVYEIWNEPDMARFWPPAPNAAQFASLQTAAVAAIKAADPTAIVLPAAVSRVDAGTRRFWDELAASGGFAGLSTWSSHLYINEWPERRWPDVLEVRNRALSVVKTKDYWCTEWGYSCSLLSPAKSGLDAVARERQARYVVRMLMLSWWAEFRMMIIYDIRDDGTDPAEKEHNFGLLARDYTRKPSMTALQIALAQVKGRSLEGLLDSASRPEGLHVARFSGQGSTLYVAWIEDYGAECTLVIPGLRARVLDMKGNWLVPTRNAADTEFVLSEEAGPVYIDVPN